MAKRDTKQKLSLLEKRVLKLLEEDTRSKVLTQQGQIYVHNVDGTKLLVEQLYLEAGFSEEQSKSKSEQINEKIEQELELADKKALRGLSKAIVKEKKEEIEFFRQGKASGRAKEISENSGQFKLFFVYNYGTAASIKLKIGKEIEKDTSGKIKQSKFTGAAQKGQTIDELSGQQIGHGEFGAPVIGYKVAKIKQLLSKFGDNDRLIQKIEAHEKKAEITTALKSDQLLTATGRFKKSYTFLISGQDARANQEQKELELTLRNAVEQELYQDLPNLKGSPSANEAIESVLLYPFEKNGKKSKVKAQRGTKPSKHVKSSSSAKSTTKQKKKQKTSIISGSMVTKSKAKAKTKPSATNTLAIIQEFNRRLPEQLQKNMQTPALNYRTGRFAESVRVVDSVTTPRGFQSFGYTYQKYPYQTFEPGYAMGSVERDPRKLIDRSMREIAVELALTRFYTRRV